MNFSREEMVTMLVIVMEATVLSVIAYYLLQYFKVVPRFLEWRLERRVNRDMKKSMKEAISQMEERHLSRHPFQESEEVRMSTPPGYLGGFVPPITMNQQFTRLAAMNQFTLTEEQQEAMSRPTRIVVASPTTDFTLTVDPNAVMSESDRQEIVRRHIAHELRTRRQRDPSLPPVTQENCMHYWKQMTGHRVCTICAKIELAPERLCPGGIHAFQEPVYKKDRQRTMIVKVCKNCDFIQYIPLKTVAELKQSKVRSIIFEGDDGKQ